MPVHNTRTALATPPRHTVASMMGMAVKFQRRTLDEPCPYVLSNQLVGVELEYENAREAARRILDPARSSGYWNVTSDASLREHGEEFVLREGLEGLELAYAIREFFTITHGTGLRETGRTSCHVHLDMRDAHIELLRATVLVYQAVEKMFWSLVHRQRRWTGYCIPLAEAQGQLIALLFSNRATQGGSGLRQATDSVTRYSGLNVASISRHGTVEFRHFNNPADEAQMNEWINICMSVKMAGAALVAAAGAASILNYVNEDTSRVVDVIQSNTILAAACARAGMTRADMQLEVDQLLAITESIYPTTAVNGSAGITTERTPEEMADIFGHSQGIRFRANGNISDYNKPKLQQAVKYLFIEHGMSTARAADYSSRYTNDLTYGGWPRDTDGAQRSWARTRLSAYLAGNVGVLNTDDVVRIFEERILSVWEAEVDRADAEAARIREEILQEQEQEEVRYEEANRAPYPTTEDTIPIAYPTGTRRSTTTLATQAADVWGNPFLEVNAPRIENVPVRPERPVITPAIDYQTWAVDYQNRLAERAREVSATNMVVERRTELDNTNDYYTELNDDGEPS